MGRYACCDSSCALRWVQQDFPWSTPYKHGCNSLRGRKDGRVLEKRAESAGRSTSENRVPLFASGSPRREEEFWCYRAQKVSVNAHITPFFNLELVADP